MVCENVNHILNNTLGRDTNALWAMGKSQSLYSDRPDPPLISCAGLNKLWKLSELPFPHVSKWGK